jgi:hypothetical protein
MTVEAINKPHQILVVKSYLADIWRVTRDKASSLPKMQNMPVNFGFLACRASRKVAGEANGKHVDARVCARSTHKTHPRSRLSQRGTF